MQRRTVLAASTTALLAGCLTPNNPDDDTGGGYGSPPDWAPVPDGASVTDQFETDPDRPLCSVDSETVTVQHSDGETETRETVSTPAYPEATAYAGAPAFVEAFEKAYVTHDALCGRAEYVTDMRYLIAERTTLDRHSGVTTVYLWRFAGPSAGVSEDGGPMWVATIGPQAVVYAVDSSGLARAVADEPVPPTDGLETAAPDPLTDGTLVAAFR